jgi:hypothetical protein
MKSSKGAPQTKTRLTRVKYAGRRLGVSDYHVLKFVAAGRLEAEPVDDGCLIKVESLDRLVKELAA